MLRRGVYEYSEGCTTTDRRIGNPRWMIYQLKNNWEAPCKSVVYSLRKYNDFLNYKENTREFVIFVSPFED